MDADDYAEHLINKNDKRIIDKWDDAGCIELPENNYLFFGNASS